MTGASTPSGGTFISIGNGTQDFSRLLNEVKRIAPQLPQPVVVQHGRTPFACDAVEHFDFTDEPGFKSHLARCAVFITHGGGGSVFTAVRMGKRPVVVPRRAAENEIVDDHQLWFADELARQGKVEPVYDVADLLAATQRVLADPAPADDSADTARAIDVVREAVHGFAPRPDDMVLLIAPSGGHLTELHSLAPCYVDRRRHFVINTPIVMDERMANRTTLLTLSQRDANFIFNIIEAWRIIRRHRPAVILTTGGSIAVPFIIFGWLLRIPTVYVETVAKVVVPTLTGRIVYPWATRFFYQWPYLDKFFPKGRFIGLII